jgi:hypothetical protein
MPPELFIALLATVTGVVYLGYAYFGYLWNRTKSESWLLTMSSIEGETGYSLTAAKTFRGIIRYPRRHLIIGCIGSVIGLAAWIVIIVQSLVF